MAVNSTLLSLRVADGTTMQAYCARPHETAPMAALIVGQEAFGVNSHIRSICDRLAGEGYVAIAPEFFHRTAEAGFTCPYTDFDAARPHTSALSTEGITADLDAAHRYICTSFGEGMPVASIGFCMGGRVSFIANLTLPVRAAVSFYGGGIVPLLPRVAELHAPHLFVWAGRDKNITHEHVEQIGAAMTAAAKPFVNAVFSDAQHGFNCDERAAYDPDPAREAWALALTFLRNKLTAA